MDETMLNKAVQVMSSLQNYAPTGLQESNKENKLSVYKPDKVSAVALAHGINLLKGAFPRLNDGWYATLTTVLDEEKFSDQKFKDAVMSAIKNCQYPEPTLANIINYDKYVDVYFYDELLEKTNNFTPTTRAEFLSQYQTINFHGQLRWAKKEDVEKYNLTKWQKTT